MSLLECNGLTKCYSGKKALNNVNLKLEPGRIIGLLGPNGSGKSTFIKLCAGLLTPNAGDIHILGLPIGPETKGMVAYLPERTYLSKWETVREIVDFFDEMYDNFQKDKAYQMLQDLNINPEDKLKTMSKGTKEKVQLILVMSRKADLYLLDEPEAALSPQRQMSLLVEIARCAAQGSQFIIASHSPILLAMPEAEILCFDANGIRPCAYEETESYRITKLFLDDRKRILHHLLAQIE